MAKQTTTNPLAKYKDRVKKAHAAHKNDETVVDKGSRLPAGIEEGVAQLTELRIGTYEKGDNKGEPFFYAAGVVIEPKTHNGRRVEGLRTSIIEPLHDTPQKQSRKTFDDHWAWMLNELRKLGVNTREVDGDPEEVTALFAAVVDDAPYFGFRTWKGKPTAQYPNPRVNETWEGQVEYAPQDDGSDEDEYEAQDDSSDDQGDQGEGTEHTLEELGEMADNGDEEAAGVLDQAATDAGLDSSQYGTWAELAAALEEGGDEEDAQDDAGDDTDEGEEEAVDWAQMGELADGGDEEAVGLLTTAAEGMEIDPNEYATWAEVAELVAGGDQDEATEGDDDDDDDGDDGDDGDEGEELGPRDMGELADEGDEDCAAKLDSIARELDIDPDGFGTWADVAEAVCKERAVRAKNGGSDSEEDAEEVVEPNKGEIYQYKPPKSRKVVSCEVTAVFQGKQTCNLRNIANKVAYKGVNWADLIPED